MDLIILGVCLLAASCLLFLAIWQVAMELRYWNRNSERIRNDVESIEIYCDAISSLIQREIEEREARDVNQAR